MKIWEVLIWGLLFVGCAAEDPYTRQSSDAAPSGTRQGGEGEAAERTSDGAPLQEPCDDRMTLAPSNESELQWIVFKNGTMPVVGRHAVGGEVSLAADGQIEDVSFNFSFAEAEMTSGNPLRDERILKYIFGLGKGFTINFSAKNWAPPVAAALPSEGDSTIIDVEGILSLAGKKTAIELPLLLTLAADKFRLTQASPIVFDLFADLTLGGELQALLALVDATIESSVEFRLDVELEPTCSL